MTEIANELEQIVGNTLWENEYRQLHKEIAEFPLEKIISIFSKIKIGLEIEETKLLAESFEKYERLCQEYNSCKIQLPNATNRHKKIKEEFETIKEKIGKLAENTYEQLSSSTERREQTARTYIFLQELRKKYHSTHDENKVKQAKEVLENEEQKKLLEYEIEQNKILEEIKTLNQAMKEKNYDLISQKRYILTTESPHTKEYETIFEKAKKEASEHFETLQKKKKIEQKTNKHKQKLEELLKIENPKPQDILQIKIKMEIIKGIYEVEEEKFEDYRIKNAIQEKYEKQKQHITEQIEALQKKSKQMNKKEQFDAINKIQLYKMINHTLETLRE